jgi:hypothetical protein
MKQRPLGNLSDYVMETLPERLEAPSYELIRDCERLLDSLGSFDVRILEYEDIHTRSLASLDVKMLEIGIIQSGFTPPEELTELVDQLTGDAPPVITYDELLLLNPVDDFRTFTRGEVRETEAKFYLEQRFVEECLEHVIMKMRVAIEFLKPETTLDCYTNVERAFRALAGTDGDLMPAIDAMKGLGFMTKGHFGIFRKYVSVHPTRNLKGPSGAFTARIPIMELLLHGEELPLDYMAYFEENRKYFPQQGRVEILEAFKQAQNGNTLTSLCYKNEQAKCIIGHINMIGEFLNDFRTMHYQSVARQIPDILRGDAPGTGGEVNSGEFLRNRKRATKFIKQTPE